jgi:hypothetical protein
VDAVFERGTGQAPLVLASCIPNFLGRPWRFGLIVGVTDRTERHYGGLAATEVLIRAQIDAINNTFNAPNVFNRTFEFYVDQVYSFSTAVAAEYVKPHPKHAYRMVYDGFPAVGGGWLGAYQAIYHSWAVGLNLGTFGSDATDGLTHEFGHARGAIDLYALAVDAANNPVNGWAYRITTSSIMNHPYGVSDWDAHTVNIINTNTKTWAPPIDYITKAFPPGFDVVVSDAAGKPQARVDVNFYPVVWHTRTLGATAVATGRTDAAGRFVLPLNPFDPGRPGNPWDIRYCNFLVEAKRGAMVVYRWLPIDEVQNFYFKRPKATFIIGLTL